MKKAEEISNPKSCLNKAADDELLFVLIGKDKAAADTIKYWCNRRIRLGLNSTDDAKITEALAIASKMETK